MLRCLIEQVKYILGARGPVKSIYNYMILIAAGLIRLIEGLESDPLVSDQSLQDSRDLVIHYQPLGLVDSDYCSY